MMTDELMLMLDKFTAGTGKTPTNIICGEAAFEKLRHEAVDDWGAERYLEPNVNHDGYVVRFMGIPIQVVHDPNVMETDKVYVFNKPEEEYNPINGTKWWVRKPYGNTIVDDLVDDFRDFQIKRHDAFDTFYYGKWAYDNMVTKEKPEEDIDESAFMSILNGGGFNAVA